MFDAGGGGTPKLPQSGDPEPPPAPPEVDEPPPCPLPDDVDDADIAEYWSPDLVFLADIQF